MSDLFFSSASIIGRDHMQRQANCQDSLAIRSITLPDRTRHIGIVCDGCGSGAKSEVGAHLLANLLADTLARQPELDLAQAQMAALRLMCQLVTASCGDDPEAQSQFIQTYLLATAVGFVIETPGDCIVFAAGDGLAVLNDEMYELDQHNRPDYLAYALLGRNDVALLPIVRRPSTEVHRLGIFTDGFEPELLPQVWQLPRTPRALQRQFNLWSRSRHFHDDATGIISFEF